MARYIYLKSERARRMDCRCLASITLLNVNEISLSLSARRMARAFLNFSAVAYIYIYMYTGRGVALFGRSAVISYPPLLLPTRTTVRIIYSAERRGRASRPINKKKGGRGERPVAALISMRREKSTRGSDMRARGSARFESQRAGNSCFVLGKSLRSICLSYALYIFCAGFFILQGADRIG